ncbi:MAG: cytochrome c [Pseudomonas sp.]|uniref:c-type cytochrome n=1 Tax=Pseudomonas sp. TaxID=306 RepID=UPI003399AB11
MWKKALLIPVVCLALVACGGVDPDSPLGQRQAVFKQMLKTSEHLGGMLRGRLAFDPTAFAEGSKRLEQLSRQPWQHFPQVKEDMHSQARDEVWQRQARFQELARALEQSTARLLEATTRAPLAAAELAAPLQRVEAACEACHKEFRAF